MSSRKKAAAAPAPRVRRSATEARAAILDAAEHQLVAAGPAALRLQLVADEVGVAHSTVLHHFGTREKLLEAVVDRAIAALHADLVAAVSEVARGPEQPGHVTDMLDRVATVLGDGGHGRAIVWLALSDLAPESADLRLRRMAELAHEVRRQRRKKKLPPFEDTLFVMMMAFFTLLAQSVAGPTLMRAAGLPSDARTAARFRAWLGQLLVGYLQEGGAT
jgi:AcrR family transcriptional regulator